MSQQRRQIEYDVFHLIGLTTNAVAALLCACVRCLCIENGRSIKCLFVVVNIFFFFSLLLCVCVCGKLASNANRQVEGKNVAYGIRKIFIHFSRQNCERKNKSRKMNRARVRDRLIWWLRWTTSGTGSFEWLKAFWYLVGCRATAQKKCKANIGFNDRRSVCLGELEGSDVGTKCLI